MREDSVRRRTAHMRTSDDPFWKAFRDRLREKGLDPERTFLADSWPDSHSEEGYLVTQHGEVIRFQAWRDPIAVPGREDGFVVGPEGGAARGPLPNPTPPRLIEPEAALLEIWDVRDAEEESRDDPEIAAALALAKTAGEEGPEAPGPVR